MFRRSTTHDLPYSAICRLVISRGGSITRCISPVCASITALWLLTLSSLIWQPLNVQSPTVSPSQSMLPEAGLPQSPDNSSMKSRPALKSTEAAASQSADRAFSRKQPLEQLLDGGSVPPEWEARRTLAGAFFIKIDRIEPD